jgi:hypothetical protein
MPFRRLPDGKFTKNRKEYVEAWEKIAKPITQMTGWVFSGFDPDLMFSPRDMTGSVVYLRPDFAIKIGEVLRERDELLVELQETKKQLAKYIENGKEKL